MIRGSAALSQLLVTQHWPLCTLSVAVSVSKCCMLPVSYDGVVVITNQFSVISDTLTSILSPHQYLVTMSSNNTRNKNGPAEKGRKVTHDT